MRITSLVLAVCAALLTTFGCAESDTSPGGSGGGGVGGTGGTPSPGPFTLTVNGTGYSPHGGGTLRAALVDLRNGEVTARLDPPANVSEEGMFSFEMGDVLEKDAAYRLDYFAELPGVGTPDLCEPADHRWSTSIPPVKGDVALPLIHNLNFSDVVCASFAEDPGPFDLSFFGTNYASHVGENVYVKLVDFETDQVVAGLDEPVVVAQDATWSFVMKDVLEKGVAYKLVYFADHNMPGNGACEPPPEDHVWSQTEKLENPIQDVVIHKEHLAQFDDGACKYFE